MIRPSWRYKLTLLFVYLAAYALFYILPNFHPLSAPTYLPLLNIDRAVPFLPWTFVIYLSDYLIFTASVLIINEMDRWNAYVRMAFGTLLTCGLFFLFFPTTYPRPAYPVLESGLVSFCMNLIGAADTPNNCFPSMHVALTSVVTWNLRHKSRPVFLCFVVWTVAIILSTLTTKQHYFMDIVGGLAVVAVLGLVDRVLVHRKVWTDSRLAKVVNFRRTP